MLSCLQLSIDRPLHKGQVIISSANPASQSFLKRKATTGPATQHPAWGSPKIDSSFEATENPLLISSLEQSSTRKSPNVGCRSNKFFSKMERRQPINDKQGEHHAWRLTYLDHRRHSGDHCSGDLDPVVPLAPLGRPLARCATTLPRPTRAGGFSWSLPHSPCLTHAVRARLERHMDADLPGPCHLRSPAARSTSTGKSGDKRAAPLPHKEKQPLT